MDHIGDWHQELTQQKLPNMDYLMWVWLPEVSCPVFLFCWLASLFLSVFKISIITHINAIELQIVTVCKFIVGSLMYALISVMAVQLKIVKC